MREMEDVKQLQRRKRETERIQYVCEQTGWDYEYAREKMLLSKEIAGSTFEYYVGFRLWEYTEEEQKDFFLKRDADIIVNKFNTKRENVSFAWNKQKFLQRYHEYLGRPWIITSKMDFDGFKNTFSNEDKIIYKPKSASAGAGIRVFDLKEGNIENIYSEIAELKDGVVEGFVKQHEKMKKLSLKGVNTIRVVTLYTDEKFSGLEENKVYIAYAAVRMCQGDAYTDNAHQGGLVAGVDIETGIIDTDGFDYKGQIHEVHPNTKTKIKGFEIPYFDELKQLIDEAGRLTPGYFGWDIAISENGPVVIEINSHPGAELLQLPYVPQKRGMKFVMEKFINAQPLCRKPETPYGLKISDISSSGIEFYWKKLSVADGYEVYRGYKENDKFELIYNATKRNIGTYRDGEFDKEKEQIFYTVKSYIVDDKGEKRYSELVKPVKASKINHLKIDRECTYLYDGIQRKLTVIYGWDEPEGGKWSSSDETIATVNEKGIITGIAEGECIITYTNALIDDSCSSKVIVNRKPEKQYNNTSRYEWDEGENCWRNRNTTNVDQAIITMVGDLMCGKLQMKHQVSKQFGWDFKESFKYVKEITNKSDLAIANLETLVASGWPYMSDEAYIDNYNNCNAPAQYLDAVKYGGFDAISMSNNHNCDGGVRALKETLSAVEESKLIYTGVFGNSTKKRYEIINVNNIKIGFLAYISSETGFNKKEVSWTDDEKNTYLNIFSKERAIEDIKGCKNDGAEYVIVYMHWGLKNFRTITERQKVESYEVAEAGADYIVGANPHLLQFYDELVTENNRVVPCFYSTGNFLSVMNQVKGNRDSVAIRIHLGKDAFGKVRLLSNNYIPFHCYGMLDGYKWNPIPVYEEFFNALTKPNMNEYFDYVKSVVGKKISPYYHDKDIYIFKRVIKKKK